MPRIPKPANHDSAPRKSGRPAILPADYNDEVTDTGLDVLRQRVKKELGEPELELIDGPAW